MKPNPESLKTAPARFIEETIKSFILENPDNCLKDIDGSPIFDEPLVGFADGDDPLFQDYKRIIDDSHFTPGEVLEKHLREVEGVEKPAIAGVSVIAWVLPISRETRLAHRMMTEGPSLHWNHVRWYGQVLNDNLVKELVSILVGQGYRAVAPEKTPFFKTFDLSDGRNSNWSHRHVAYAAGLGTFSLNGSLITTKGMAIRCDSMVTDLKLPPTPRTYSSHTDNCRFLSDGTCGLCAARCPAGAITAQGRNKRLCQKEHRVTQKPWLEKPGYIAKFGVAGCGLCQTRVPCEHRIPVKVSKRFIP